MNPRQVWNKTVYFIVPSCVSANNKLNNLSQISFLGKSPLRDFLGFLQKNGNKKSLRIVLSHHQDKDDSNLWACLPSPYPLSAPATSVSRLGDFWKFLMTWFQSKVVQIHGGLLG